MTEPVTYEEYKQTVEAQTGQLMRSIAQVATGARDVTIEIPDGIDELSDLAIGLNFLVDDMNDLVNSQEALLAELEERVAARTRELETTLQETQIINQVAEAISEASGLEETLSNISLALTYNSLALQADQAAFLSLETDESGQPQWGEYVATWRPDNKPGRQLGERHRLSPLAFTKYWQTVPPTIAIVSDGEQDERLDERSRAVYLAGGMQATLIMPLTVGGRWLGLFTISWANPTDFSDQERRIFAALTRQIASHFENRQLFARTERALEELQKVQRRYVREEWTAYTSAVNNQPAGESNGRETPAKMTAALNQAVNSKQLTIETPAAAETAALAVPLRYADELIGVLGFSSEESALWDDENITAVEAVVEQLGLALENQRLFDEAQQRAAELGVLNEMVSELTSLLEIEPILESIYRYTSRLMATTNFTIALHNRQTDEIAFPIAIEQSEPITRPPQAFGNGLREHILGGGDGLFIDEGVDSWLASQSAEFSGRSAACWMGVPLRLGNDVVGVISVESAQAGTYTRAQFDLLRAIANQAAIAMQNARQFQQEQARAQRQQMLREIAAKVRSSADVDSIMRTAVQEVGQALGRQTFVYLDPQADDEAAEDA